MQKIAKVWTRLASISFMICSVFLSEVFRTVGCGGICDDSLFRCIFSAENFGNFAKDCKGVDKTRISFFYDLQCIFVLIWTGIKWLCMILKRQ